MSNNSDDPVILLLAIGAILAGLGWLVWHFFRPEFLEALRYLRLLELAPLTLIDDNAAACFKWLRIAPKGTGSVSLEVYSATRLCFGPTLLQNLPAGDEVYYYNLSGKSVMMVNRLVGSYFKWIVAIVGAGFAYYMSFVSQRTKFKTRYNLEGFIKIQARVWPTLVPIVDFNPAKHSARILGSALPQKLPTFAEALAPEEWLAFHAIPVINGVPERDRVRRMLQAQLGPKWTGFDGLPVHITVLLAAFALKGAQKRDESDDFLGELSLCWTHAGGFKPSGELVARAKKILKDPEVGGLALTVADRHAFRTTAVLGVLKWARFMGGVLASAQFLWLRGVDRTLWYALNNLGRRSFHSEGAGAMAHFMAEEAAQKTLPIPRLDTAIIAINKYLADTQPRIPSREKNG